MFNYISVPVISNEAKLIMLIIFKISLILGTFMSQTYTQIKIYLFAKKITGRKLISYYVANIR